MRMETRPMLKSHLLLTEARPDRLECECDQSKTRHLPEQGAEL